MASETRQPAATAPPPGHFDRLKPLAASLLSGTAIVIGLDHFAADEYARMAVHAFFAAILLPASVVWQYSLTRKMRPG